jgi:hypothetical protein
MFAAFTLVFSATAGSTTQAALAIDPGEAELKPIPFKSLVDDENSQLLELKFKLQPGSNFEKVVVTIDKGTSEEKSVEFGVDENGETDLINPPLNPPFEVVFGQITLLTSDGYYYAIGKAFGHFIIAMNKTELGAGEHKALAEVVLEGDILTDDTKFILLAPEDFLPDLVAKYFFAPGKVLKPLKKDLPYWTTTIETNEGNVKAKHHQVRLFLSEDNAISGDDKKLGLKNVKHLNVGDFKVHLIKIKTLKTVDPGDYFLIVKVDIKENLTDKIEESDEDNNQLSKKTKIIAT